MKHLKTILLATTLFALLTGFPSVVLSAEKGLVNPFFVLSNGVADDTRPTPDSQAKMLAELGCQGIGPSGSAGVPEMLAALSISENMLIIITVTRTYLVYIKLSDYWKPESCDIHCLKRQLADRLCYRK